MILPRLFLSVSLLASANTFAEGWQPVGTWDRPGLGSDPVYVKRSARRPDDGRAVSAHLVFFDSKRFRLKVVDLGRGFESRDTPFAASLRAAGCVAGVNGGFFHPDGRPAGLVIAGGRRINRFETAKLLSGVLYSDQRGIHLLRRARFKDRSDITALLQTGPYLVESGHAVRGLSRGASARRTFIATDWRGHWALGVTTSALTLAELAEWLGSPGALTPWTTDRAINLDGGSSSGFFFEGEGDRPPVVLRPWKRVRNLLCIVPR